MAARAAAAQAARRHLAASAIGFAAAVAVAKAFMVPQQSLSEVEADAGEGKRELQLVQVVFRHGARTPLGQKYWPELGRSGSAALAAADPYSCIDLARPAIRHLLVILTLFRWREGATAPG
jgi:hypothetical protein